MFFEELNNGANIGDYNVANLVDLATAWYPAPSLVTVDCQNLDNQPVCDVCEQGKGQFQVVFGNNKGIQAFCAKHDTTSAFLLGDQFYKVLFHTGSESPSSSKAQETAQAKVSASSPDSGIVDITAKAQETDFSDIDKMINQSEDHWHFIVFLHTKDSDTPVIIVAAVSFIVFDY